MTKKKQKTIIFSLKLPWKLRYLSGAPSQSDNLLNSLLSWRLVKKCFFFVW